MMSLDSQRLLCGNLPDVALTAAKAIYKRELSDSMSVFQIHNEPIHTRVSSAPEPTQISYNGDDEKVQLRKGRSKRVPILIRKVKAYSWPKRAILPSFSRIKYSDTEPLIGDCLTESGYSTEKSEEKLEERLLEHGINIQSKKVEICNETTDEPPARPPLPLPRKHFDTSLTSCSSPSYEKPSCHNELHQQCFNAISPRKRDSSVENSPQKRDSYTEASPRKRDSCTSQNSNDLSKNINMSLKDLIKIHEQEIARVSAVSLRPESRKSSLSESRKNSAWKRHTTIGLTNHSLDLYQDTSPNEHDEIFLKSTVSESSQRKETSEFTFDDNFTKQQISSPISSVQFNSVSSEHLPISPTSALNPGTWPLLSSKTKLNAPPTTLPKAKKMSTTVIIEPSFININSAREQFANLTSPGVNLKGPNDQCSVYKRDVMVQTEHSLVRSDSFSNEDRIVTLTSEISQMKTDFELERQDLHKRLNEQKKVANAYQKLEERYRKKVCTMKKEMKNCVCLQNRSKAYGNNAVLARRSLSPSYFFQEHHDITVQRVDNILHQLEAWLYQTEPTDRNEISSLVGSTTDEIYPTYRLTSDYFLSPPLEIIDRIDATSV